MAKPIKIFGWIIGSILGVVVLLVIGLYLFFPVEKAKQMAIEKGSAALGRPITIGDVSLSLWGGIGVTLKQLAVGNPAGLRAENPIAAEEVEVKLQFWPLLRGNVAIDRFVITGPQVTLVKLADGRTNFDFSSSNSTSGTAAEPDSKGAAAVVFKDLAVVDGNILYRDDSSHTALNLWPLNLTASIDGSQPGTFETRALLTIDSIRMISSDTAVLPQFQFDCAATYSSANGSIQVTKGEIRLADLPASVTGTVSGLDSNVRADVNLAIAKTSIAQLLSLLPSAQQTQFAEYQLEGEISLDANLQYDSLKTPALSYRGIATLQQLSMSSQSLPGKLIVGKLTTHFAVDTIKAVIENGSFANQPLSGAVDVYDFADPFAKGNLVGMIDLALLQPWLPAQDSNQVTGSCKFDLDFSGKTKQLANMNIAGKLDIVDATWKSKQLPEPITNLALKASLTHDAMTIENLAIRFVSSDLALTGKLGDPFPTFMPGAAVDPKKDKKPFLSFSLTSKHFDSDKLFPEVVPDPSVRPVSVPDSGSAFILPDINGQGTFSIAELVYCKVDLTNVTGKVKIANRVINCYDVTGKVYTGAIAGTTAIDLNDFENPKYTGTFNASQIEANDFVTRFSTFSGIVFGKIDLNGNYSATGWEPDQFFKSLSLDGLSSLKSGKVVTSGPVFESLNGLASKLGKTIEAEQAVKDLATKLTVKDGKVFLDNLKTSLGSLGEIQLGGFYGFDGALGYNGNLLLSKEMGEKLSAKGALLGGLSSMLKNKESGQISLPLTATGTITSPKVAFDYSALGKDALKNLVGDSVSGLQKLLKK